MNPPILPSTGDGVPSGDRQESRLAALKRFLDEFRADPKRADSLASELSVKLHESDGVEWAMEQAVAADVAGDIDAVRLLVAAAGRVKDPRAPTMMLARFDQLSGDGRNYLVFAVAQLRGEEDDPDRRQMTFGDFFELRPVREPDAVAQILTLLEQAESGQGESGRLARQSAANLILVTALSAAKSSPASDYLRAAIARVDNPLRDLVIGATLQHSNLPESGRIAGLVLAGGLEQRHTVAMALGAAAARDDRDVMELVERRLAEWDSLDVGARRALVGGARELVHRAPRPARAEWSALCAALLAAGLNDESGGTRDAAAQAFSLAIVAGGAPRIGGLEATVLVRNEAIRVSGREAVAHAIGQLAPGAGRREFESMVRDAALPPALREAAWKGARGATAAADEGVRTDLVALARNVIGTEADSDVAREIQAFIGHVAR